ncbi:MAG TPA: sugar phosphate isomerase/epimerase [Ruminiclostridium sp.]|uniref:Fructoselysine 3-epimerase n=1 Tax=Acetivibrio saccincola TaxID=1677857 RepID=A0A2K9ECH4_9FIRM|nr:sugar phosphate isomerase/epimerase family protein [Acetivibrio saccincola]HAA43037.1 sugar phosphate isomerase/epimerase [Ruminiclostridium sp.]AUG56915.1 fructoselysine 3-epimerase [Acetivibrio saccincola]NLW27742.1 sugar phosphate isomerase/epimerase [Acetivibrio saccincola]PQQ66943.1 xylose isomerase [Acetivibrio saccincola]HQD28686.1 sugar phosphate isomerase/epimerase family protein [Acetivibrio saccincola]
MKVSFSTLGCPEWSWAEITAMAKDLGFNGIEIRGVGKELYAPKIKEFLPENIEGTKKKLEEMGLSIPCFTSSSCLFDESNIETNMEEAKEYIDTASAIGTKYVRVLGDGQAEPKEDISLDFLADSLIKLADYAKEKNVIVLVETNGVLSDSLKMSELMKKVSSANIAVLWDVHHPYRFMNEPVEETYSRLKDFIKHVHIKDSVMEEGAVKYKMTGHGDVPVKEAIKLLMENNFEGYISYEWVKRWCDELEDPGVAFSQFINYIKGIIR